MGHKEMENKFLSDFYQDIIDFGGLDHAINEALKNVGSNLKAAPSVEWPFFSYIEYKERFSQIMLAKNERLYSVDLWCEGICYGSWWLKDLIQVAAFIKYSIELQLSVKELRKLFTWFDSEKGKLHEKGAKKETKQGWKDKINWLEKETTTLKYLLPCVKIAKGFKELAVLFPYTSMNTLCFSLTTGFPYVTIGPQITAWEEYIEVKFGENEYKKLYSTKELKEYMKQNIVSYGIARQGTADSIGY